MRLCVWQCQRGDWHRSLFHVWRHRALSKFCARCGYSKLKTF